MLTACKYTNLQKQSSVSLRITPALKLWLPKRKYIFSVVFFSLLKKRFSLHSIKSFLGPVSTQGTNKTRGKHAVEQNTQPLKTSTSPEDTYFYTEKKNLLSLCFSKETQLVHDKTNTPFKTHLGFASKLEPQTFAPCRLPLY